MVANGSIFFKTGDNGCHIGSAKRWSSSIGRRTFRSFLGGFSVACFRVTGVTFSTTNRRLHGRNTPPFSMIALSASRSMPRCQVEGSKWSCWRLIISSSRARLLETLVGANLRKGEGEQSRNSLRPHLLIQALFNSCHATHFRAQDMQI